MANDFCVLPYQETLEGIHPKLCQGGDCEDCLIYKQIAGKLHPLEEINHLVFHAIARKYGIDVDLVGEVATDFTDMVSALVEGIPHISEN